MKFGFRKSTASIARPLTSEDAIACARLHKKSFRIGWAVSEFELLLANSNVISDGTFHQSSAGMIGFVLSRVAVDEGELLTIAVDPDRRNSKIGSGLLEGHIDSLRLAGVKNLFLEVAEDNIAGLKLYRKFGFETVGKRPNYYSSEGDHRINAEVMTLRF